MPIYRRLPKRGFNKPNKVDYTEVNLSRVQAAVDAKKLDTSAPVTAAVLVAAGVISSPLGGVRLLGKGELKAKVNFEVYHATAGAVAAVEKAGGSVKMLKPVEQAAEQK
jgi:large subunit ribosomal protein L15